MSNEVVRLLFQNYHLIREESFEVFRREQSQLLSPELVTIASDKRGTLRYQGIDGFFEGMIAWSRHFFVNGQSRHEYLDETPTHVFVRMHGELKLLEPINGVTTSRETEHDWTEEFELFDDLITKVEIRLSFSQKER